MRCATVVVLFCWLILIGESKPIDGLGYAYKHTCDDLTKLQPKWYYGWDYKQSCPNVTIPWIPMIKFANLSHIAPTLRGKDYPALLGYNEPNAAGHANINTSVALENWKLLMEADLPLCSPAPTRSGWFSWLVDFFVLTFLCTYGRNSR